MTVLSFRSCTKCLRRSREGIARSEPEPVRTGNSVADKTRRKAIRRSEQVLSAAFGSFGLGVEAVGTIEGPQVTRVRLKPASGVKVASLSNRAEDLQVALALDQPPLVNPGKGFVAVDVPRTDRQTMPLLDYLKGAGGKEKSPTAFPVGVGIDGQTIVSDFFDSNTCHVLVAGTSGSGKSEWLKSLVASPAFRNAPERVRVALGPVYIHSHAPNSQGRKVLIQG